MRRHNQTESAPTTLSNWTRATVFLVLLLVGAAPAEAQRKVLEWANHRNINNGEITAPWSKQIDTVELEDILIGDQVIRIGEPIGAGIDWINQIAFRIKNTSRTDITFIQITLVLPELIHSPQIPYLAPCGNRENRACLRPGEQVDLKIGGNGKLYEWVKEQVAREKELSTISRAAIYAVYVTSSNGSTVMAGCIIAADSGNACQHGPR